MHGVTCKNTYVVVQKETKASTLGKQFVQLRDVQLDPPENQLINPLFDPALFDLISLVSRN